MTDPIQEERSPARAPDHALLRRIAERDERALAELYDRWAERVRDVAYWILQDEEEADEVVEDTFWQVWRTADRYDRRRAPGSTWLGMIARSRALDRLRARRRAGAEGSVPACRAFAEAQAAGPGDDPLAEQEGAERRAAVAAALGSLPEEQRRVLELAFFDGLSHAEVAARADLPLGTVKTRIRLAIMKLRQHLVSRRNGDL